MCLETDIDMTIDSGEPSKKKPLPIYVICVIFLWSGLKELFAGLGGAFMRWFYTLEKVKAEILKQSNYKEIIESSKLLQEITTDRYVFLTLGGITQLVAAFYLFKMETRGLTFVILGLVISLISPIIHGLLYGWSFDLGKHGWVGFLWDWVLSFIIVFYLWRLREDGRLKAS